MAGAYVHSLHVHPIKSCKAIDVNLSEAGLRGLEADRKWMIVDQQGTFVTQRERPELARVAVHLEGQQMVVRHPGMGDLFVHSGAYENTPSSRALTTRIWGDAVRAFDAGETAALWFSELLCAPHRLVRFDDAVHRASDTDWTGPDAIGLNRFTDGFPVLITNQASLDDLNARMITPLPMDRFRPNIVLAGLDPWDEDHIRAIRIGNITLRLVKPCTRCVITTTDQQTAVRGTEPLATLGTFRQDARIEGAITFGQNAIVTDGAPSVIRVGMPCEPAWNF